MDIHPRVGIIATQLQPSRCSVRVCFSYAALLARDSELVQIMDATLADAARRAGVWLACYPGCTRCCYGAFTISQLDALPLRDGMVTLRRTDRIRDVAVEHRAQNYG